MKHKLIAQQPQANDQNYINSIYSNLVQKINMLDKLNQEYKEKQQGHFLKTFMNVIEKLGKQLILAQEAYKNVDFQAKKDTYCLQLAQQVNFFKAQSVNLSKTLISTKQELKRLKLDKQILQNELLFTKNLYQKQTNSYLMLKTELKELKNQLKALTLGKHHSLFNSTGISTTNYDLISKEFQGKSNSLDKKGQKLKETLNAESLYEKQKNQIKDYDAFDSFQKERKNRNSLTLTPVAQIDRFPKHGNLTQRCFRAKKQPKERNSNMPMQYCLE